MAIVILFNFLTTIINILLLYNLITFAVFENRIIIYISMIDTYFSCKLIFAPFILIIAIIIFNKL